MADEQKDKQLDALLDSVLARYSAEEPRPGLETRIVSNLREAGTRATSSWWRTQWIWAGAAATGVVAVIVFLLLSSRQPRPQEPEVVRSNAPSQPHQPPTQPRVQLQHRDVTETVRRSGGTVRMQARVATDLRKEVFPTPVPLTDQERLLLGYLSRTPREELVAQSHPDPAPDEDLLEGRQGVYNPITNTRSSGTSN
jgi:hypothetical protein